MEHDIFISYATKDESIAEAICEKLESARIKCWIAARDISAAEDRTEAIRNAIGCSRVMVLVLSENANAAPHVGREIAHAFYTRRIIIPFRLAGTLPRRDFLFYLGNVPWCNAANPPGKQDLEALTVRIRGLVPGRANSSSAIARRRARTTMATLSFANSWIGALRASHYRTLGILKWVAIATFLSAVVWLLSYTFRPTKDRAPLAESHLRSMYHGSTVAPKAFPKAGGDTLKSQSTYAFTRFGLWQPENALPTPVLPQGTQDTPLVTPSKRLASVTPAPQSDVTPGPQEGLTPALASHSRSLPLVGMHQTPHYHRPPYHRSRGPEAQRNADLVTSQRDALLRQLKETEAKLQTTQKNLDLMARERDALQNELKESEARVQTAQKNADLATRERAALETQLVEVKERAQLAEMHANLAVSQRAAMEAELRKAEEEAQLARQNADLAIIQHSRAQEKGEDAQPSHEDAVLATNQLDFIQMQPPNPGQNAKPAPFIEALDSSFQPARP